MTRLVLRLAALVLLAVVSVAGLNSPASAIPGFPDCKEPPTPEVPGRGIAGFFSGAPDELPAEADPFVENAETTIFEQYGYAGLRWHTYDLGCGPDAMRAPDAVIGTAVSNWVVQLPLALTALTGSVTQVAFEPDFLGAFDGAVESVSSALHESLFVSWVPFVIAAIGFLIIFKARKSGLATTAGAIGWALMVVLIATALFRWPVEAGRAADATVTQTLGAVVSRVDGNGPSVDPGTAVASNVSESILYKAWLAGALGDAESKTAQTYGPDLFKAQALTWREAAVLERDPDAGKAIIEAKQAAWQETADKIQDADPEAYQYLTGERSEARVGYALLSATGAFLALPFLLTSALLLIGCFLIVRLAVMLFPAFATLGAFPASRGLVTGLGRTVGAAVVNAIIFGIGAGVTIAVLGLLFDPKGAPAWLGVVLMPLFSVIMWVALKPFRRLTSMVSPHEVGRLDKPSAPWLKKLVVSGVGMATGGVAAGLGAFVGTKTGDADEEKPPPERAEGRPSVETVPTARPTARPAVATSTTAQPLALTAAAGSHKADEPPPNAASAPPPPSPRGPDPDGGTPAGGSLGPGFVPRPTGAERLEPAESEEFDGEEIYVIYRPADDETQASA